MVLRIPKENLDARSDEGREYTISLLQRYEELAETSVASEMLYSLVTHQYMFLDHVALKTTEEIERLKLVNTRRSFLHIDIINMVNAKLPHLGHDHSAQVFYLHEKLNLILQANPLFHILEERPSPDCFSMSTLH